MLRLIKIDFKKYAYTRTFWVLLLLYFVLIVAVFFLAESILNLVVSNAKTSAPLPIPDFSLYSFPYIWQNLAFLGGWGKILIALIVLIFVTNEFGYKTNRQNVMNGMSRGEFLASKVLFAGLLSLAATIVLFLSGLLLGFGHTPEFSFSLIFENLGFLAAYFLELLTLSLMAMFAAFLLKSSGLAIILFAVYYIVIENILSWVLPDSIASFLPVHSLESLIDVPNSALMQMFGVNFSESVSIPDVFICLFWCLAFIGITFLFLKKRDF